MKNIILRNDPLFEILLFDNSFEIKNDKSVIGNGVYQLHSINSIRIENKTNWLISILSYLMVLILQSGGGLYYDRNLLRFDYNGEPLEISLNGCDLNLARETIEYINQQLSQHQ